MSKNIYIQIPRFDDGTFPMSEQEIQKDRADYNKWKSERIQNIRQVHHPTKPNNFQGTEENFQNRSKNSFNHQVDSEYVNNKRKKLAYSKSSLDNIRRIQGKNRFQTRC